MADAKQNSSAQQQAPTAAAVTVIINHRRSITQLHRTLPHKDDLRTPAEKIGKPHALPLETVRFLPGLSLRDSSTVEPFLKNLPNGDIEHMPLETLKILPSSSVGVWVQMTASTPTLRRLGELAPKFKALCDAQIEALVRSKSAKDEE